MQIYHLKSPVISLIKGAPKDPPIFLHFKEEEGGFSYFKESCQTHYYDVKFSDSLNIADLHGTLLFTWAIVMILEVTENKLFDFNIIKP